MRIIKDNFNKYPIEVECFNCKSIIELESGKDVMCVQHVADQFSYGQQAQYTKYWECPLCKTNNKL